MINKFLGTGEKGYHPWRKFKVILSGIRFAVLHDFSVLYKLILSILVLIATVVFDEKFDVTLIILATGVMLASELFNTAIEAMCDYMQTQYDEKIHIVKDIAAAAAGMAIFAWLAVLAIEFAKLLPYLKTF